MQLKESFLLPSIHHERGNDSPSEGNSDSDIAMETDTSPSFGYGECLGACMLWNEEQPMETKKMITVIMIDCFINHFGVPAAQVASWPTCQH